MMPSQWILSLCLVSATLLVGVASQNLQYEYVVLFMKNTVSETSTPETVEVYVASRSQQTVTVTIDNPNGGLITSSTFSLTPDEVRMVDLPALSRQDDPLDNKAIRVVGSGDIIVYAMNRNLFSTDGLTVFSTEQVGMEYYAMAYTPSEFDTQIGLIAMDDGITNVEITIPDQTVVDWLGVQYNSGQTFTVTLDARYRTALVSSLLGDLTGARLVSDKKFSAFSGDVRTTVYDGTSRDHLCEQLPPVEQWGFSYYTVRTPSRTSDRPDVVRVVAHDDNTQVQVTGALNQQFTLQSGEYRELIAYGSLYINSDDKSVLVAVFSSSQSKTDTANDIGDPSMIIMPAEGQYSADYTFSTPTYRKPPGADTDQYTIYVLVIVKTVDISGLRLNSQSLINVAWTSISGTEYSRGEVPVDNGRTYNLAHEDPLARFMALLYGSADRESFYFPIDVGMANINVITPVDIVGNKGEKGDNGARGPAGNAGIKGNVGLKGTKGERGDRGDKGDRGTKGDAGDPSSFGATGATGAAGATGATGPAGVAGAVGPIGATGSTGATGATGLRGPPGVKGQQGTVGDPGATGEPGYRGAAGRKGEKGEAGDEGTKGVVGPPGIPGDPGYVAVGSCDGVCSVKDSATDMATCRLTYGTVSHLCSCPPGFHLTLSNPNECVDINECELEFCSHGCENSIGGYMCKCPDGYELAGRNCVDIDECLVTGTCNSDDVCVNSIGSFVCLSMMSTPQAQTENLVGLQTLYRPEFFIAVLCLLILMTVLLMASSICLLVRHRTRSGLEKRRHQLVMEQTRVVYPAPGMTHDAYY